MGSVKIVAAALVGLLGLIVGPMYMIAFVGSAFVAFLVLCALDSLGLFKITRDNFTLVSAISLATGLVLLIVIAAVFDLSVKL